MAATRGWPRCTRATTTTCPSRWTPTSWSASWWASSGSRGPACERAHRRLARPGPARRLPPARHGPRVPRLPLLPPDVHGGGLGGPDPGAGPAPPDAEARGLRLGLGRAARARLHGGAARPPHLL